MKSTAIRSQKGMTLVEMVIGMAILSLVMLVTMIFVNQMADAVAFETNVTDLQVTANKLQTVLLEEMRAARLPDEATLADAGFETFRIQSPVDHDDDGDVFDVNMAVEWGYLRPDVDLADTLDADATYQFEPTSVFKEADRNLDLNRDGDTTDEFDVGRITKVISAAGTAAAVTVPQTGQTIVRLKDTVVGDIDGDGNNDPIFRLTNNQLEVTLFLANVSAATPYLVKSTTAIDLRNL